MKKKLSLQITGITKTREVRSNDPFPIPTAWEGKAGRQQVHGASWAN
jgi:hypothetical protein